MPVAQAHRASFTWFWAKDRPLPQRLYELLVGAFLIFLRLKMESPWLRGFLAIGISFVGFTILFFVVDLVVGLIKARFQVGR